jgi:hypothetical protein
VSHAIETIGDEARNTYRATMPNGATAECWTVIDSWDGDEEYGFTGDWTPYGLAYNPDHEVLDGDGSTELYHCLEQWRARLLVHVGPRLLAGLSDVPRHRLDPPQAGGVPVSLPLRIQTS